MEKIPKKGDHSLYRSLNIARKISSRRCRWIDIWPEEENVDNALKLLTDKSTVKRPLGRSRLRWPDCIRMDLKEKGVSTRN